MVPAGFPSLTWAPTLECEARLAGGHAVIDATEIDSQTAILKWVAHLLIASARSQHPNPRVNCPCPDQLGCIFASPQCLAATPATPSPLRIATTDLLGKVAGKDWGSDIATQPAEAPDRPSRNLQNSSADHFG